MRRHPALLLTILVLAGGPADAQTPAPASDAQTIDVFDLLRRLRHKEPDPEEAVWDYRKPMKAFAPVIGAKPSSGVLFGVAGNLAFYRGEPSTTRISSAVASLTFSTKGQTSLSDRLIIFTRADRWRLDGDQRFQWTSLETHGLGTSADTRNGVESSFDFFRLHHTLYYQLRPGLFAGAGLYFDDHTSIGPKEGAESEWATSPFVQYSEAHNLPLDAQVSAGSSVDFLWDSRDTVINPRRGWLAKASYRMLFDGFLGGDSNWRRLSVICERTRRWRMATATRSPSGSSRISSLEG